jgi:peroxiredoxin Q/BCP
MLSWLFSKPLPCGAAAPAFTLPDDAGRQVSPSALDGQYVLLVFYPADNTPG